MTPETITAVGGVIAIILGAAATWQGKELAELKKKVEQLEGELSQARGLLRTALHYIRTLIWHVREVEDAHRDGRPEPSMPPVPVLLKDEV